MEECHVLVLAQYSTVKITSSDNVTLSFFAAIGIALIVVVRGAAADENHYTILFFPPTICEDDGRTIYTALLPPSLSAALLFTMLSVIGLVIHKVKCKYPNTHCAVNKTMHKNGLIVLLSYSIRYTKLN